MHTEILNKIAALLAQAVPQSPSDGHPYVVGKWYAIRTLTMIQTGRLEAVYEKELVLSSAAWIADTGRWMQFCENPQNALEVEPFANDVIVSRSNIIDASQIIEFLPNQK
jgi:hypothetical protein